CLCGCAPRPQADYPSISNRAQRAWSCRPAAAGGRRGSRLGMAWMVVVGGNPCRNGLASSRRASVARTRQDPRPPRPGGAFAPGSHLFANTFCRTELLTQPFPKILLCSRRLALYNPARSRLRQRTPQSQGEDMKLRNPVVQVCLLLLAIALFAGRPVAQNSTGKGGGTQGS